MNAPAHRPIWREYDSAARWCARRGHTGSPGSPLPPLLSRACETIIEEDPEAFERRVREFAYALALERVPAEED